MRWRARADQEWQTRRLQTKPRGFTPSATSTAGWICSTAPSPRSNATSKEHGGAALTVTLGDYVDRGPASRGVLERLSANPFPTPYVALKGNHELLLEAFLADPALGPQWRDFGGLETLHSYGVPVGRFMMGRDYDGGGGALRDAMPAQHAGFLQSLKISHSHGKYFLCHAGVRPGVPLDRQDEHDLLWIRDEFLDSDMDFGKIVVHGHTPVEQPEVKANRINIDTGAFATGQLTCVALDDAATAFLKSDENGLTGGSFRDLRAHDVQQRLFFQSKRIPGILNAAAASMSPSRSPIRKLRVQIDRPVARRLFEHAGAGLAAVAVHGEGLDRAVRMMRAMIEGVDVRALAAQHFLHMRVEGVNVGFAV